MELKTREELTLMSKEELEALVLHLQEEISSLFTAAEGLRETKNMFFERATLMEERLTLLMQMLKSWEVK